MRTSGTAQSWVRLALPVVWVLLAIASALRGQTVLAVLFAVLAAAYVALQVVGARRDGDRPPRG